MKSEGTMFQSFRRLHRIHHHARCLLPLSRTLSPAFHRTCFVPSQTSIPLSSLHHHVQKLDVGDPGLVGFLGAIEQVSHLPTESEAVTALEDSGIEASPDVIRSAIWVFRDDSRLSFLAFNWGQKLGCCDEEAWNLMIWVLGNHKKFNTAWCLIRDLHKASVDTRRAMLTMIDRYAFANDPSKAIWTFQVMEKFSLSPDEEAFHGALDALCRHGYIEEAEEFMVKNKKLFPLKTDGFNIILDAWCNVSLDVFEAKRIWREISKCCLTPNEESHTHMISCFSKVGNLFDSLRLYDEMKKRGWIPGIEVYNSLVSVLTRENCFNEALKLLEKMKESGLKPDFTTYNAIITPLCKAMNLHEARTMLNTMIEENIRPNTETFHGVFEISDLEETLEDLNQMKKASLGPDKGTFFIILEKFFRLKQPENALKIWTETMKRYEIVPDSTHYRVMIQGLEKCGSLIKAREILTMMRSNGVDQDPMLETLLKESVRRNTSKKTGRKKGSV